MRADTLNIDRFQALSLLQEEGQPDVLAEMVTLFLEESRGWLSEARRAAASGDFSALKRIAHSMKGASATIGAEGMCADAASLEHALGAGLVEDAAALIDSLTEELARVTELLRPYGAQARTDNSPQRQGH